MTFAEAVRHCLSNYATFSGRARRAEYWWFILFNVLVALVLVGLGTVLGLATGEAASDPIEPGLEQIGLLGWVFYTIYGLFFLAMLMPGWAVAVRRFHDLNLSGWLYLALTLAGFIPVVGWLPTLGSFVITVLRGKPGPNRFGPDPLNPSSADVFS